MNWLKENWFKISIILVGLLIAIALLSIAGYYGNISNAPENNIKKSSTTRFYLKSVANVRECAGLDCKIIGQYPQNTSFDLAYDKVDNLPEWVLVSLIKQNNQYDSSGLGYINKVLFSDTSTVINLNQTQQQNYSTKPDLVAVIKRWRPLIAYIECNFKYTTGETYLVQSGSGTLWGHTNLNDVLIFTNKHVITDSEGYYPDSCVIKLPDHDKVFYIPLGQKLFTRFNDYDFAIIKIPDPDNYVVNLVNSTKHSLFCDEGKPPLGSSIIILGYPGIGSKIDITATEGIISGYDNNYYITSAKIEHGNSGGAAILIGYKDSCILGVPTFAITGTVESLARILSWENILNFKF